MSKLKVAPTPAAPQGPGAVMLDQLVITPTDNTGTPLKGQDPISGEDLARLIDYRLACPTIDDDDIVDWVESFANDALSEALDAAKAAYVKVRLSARRRPRPRGSRTRSSSTIPGGPCRCSSWPCAGSWPRPRITGSTTTTCSA